MEAGVVGGLVEQERRDVGTGNAGTNAVAAEVAGADGAVVAAIERLGDDLAYPMSRRTERAMALLRRGDLGVRQVCFAVCCSSLGTFSSRFTELVGAPPGVCRRWSVRDGGYAVLRGETVEPTGQKSRCEGAGPRVDSPWWTA